MRKSMLPVPLTVSLLGLSAFAWAADTPQAVIDKAVKAHGGLGKLTKALESKGKGTLHVANNNLPFTQQAFASPSGQFKEVMELEVNGQKVRVITVFDGKQGWINANGQAVNVDDKLLKELKEASYMMQVGRLAALKDPAITLALIGEVMVNGRPVLGVKVSSKGHRDIDLYFDKATGLMAKVERRTVDIMSGQEVTEERIVLEYQEVDGMKTTKKAVVNRDGKKFMELELTEVKFPEKIDDSEFAMP
jgi:hypothetical protein